MINTVLCEMPYSVKATHTINTDDTYTIFINNKLTMEQQRKAYKHELKHIKRKDLHKDKKADDIEKEIRE